MRGRDRCRAPGRETTTSPASPRSRASCVANLMPSADALRAPTIATISRCSSVETPEHGDEGRRRIEHGKARREIRFDRRDEPAAELGERVDLRAAHRPRSECAARPRRRRVAQGEALPSAPRAHRRSARSAQQSSPVRYFRCARVSARRGARSSFSVRRLRHRAPIPGSSPLIRRTMLARCATKIITARIVSERGPQRLAIDREIDRRQSRGRPARQARSSATPAPRRASSRR